MRTLKNGPHQNILKKKKKGKIVFIKVSIGDRPSCGKRHMCTQVHRCTHTHTQTHTREKERERTVYTSKSLTGKFYNNDAIQQIDYKDSTGSD